MPEKVSKDSDNVQKLYEPTPEETDLSPAEVEAIAEVEGVPVAEVKISRKYDGPTPIFVSTGDVDRVEVDTSPSPVPAEHLDSILELPYIVAADDDEKDPDPEDAE
jgi:hypothetical protein